MTFVSGIYRNKKNSILYYATGTKIDTTNVRNGAVVVVYGEYVREITEFHEKFDLVQADPLYDTVYECQGRKWTVEKWERSENWTMGSVTLRCDEGKQTMDLQTFHLLTRDR